MTPYNNTIQIPLSIQLPEPEVEVEKLGATRVSTLHPAEKDTNISFA